MPALQYNARRFALSTDYPLDKIIYMKEGSVTLPANGFEVFEFPHKLPFIPLPLGSWSDRSDWSVSYDMSPTASGPLNLSIRINSDATNIISAMSNPSGQAVTVRYRIYAFAPSDVDFETSPTNVIVDDFMLNSEFNYTKLLEADFIAQPGGGESTRIIHHGLGYYPQVSTWLESGGAITPTTYVSLGGGYEAVIEVTETSLIATLNNYEDIKLHYRIYLDD